MQTVVQQGRGTREIGKKKQIETKKRKTLEKKNKKKKKKQKNKKQKAKKQRKDRQKVNHQTKPHSITSSMGLKIGVNSREQWLDFKTIQLKNKPLINRMEKL